MEFEQVSLREWPQHWYRILYTEFSIHIELNFISFFKLYVCVSFNRKLMV